MHRKERKKKQTGEREMCNLAGRGSGAGTGPGATVTARTGPRQGLKAPGAALPGTEPSLWPDTAQEPLGRREMFIRPCQVPGLGRKGKGWERREDPHSELGGNQLQTGGVHHPGGIGSLLHSALTFTLAVNFLSGGRGFGIKGV